MVKKLIVANWKMLPESLAQAQEILDFTNNYIESLGDPPAGGTEFSLVFCPPFIFIEEAAKFLKMSHFEHEAFLGAQDIAIEDKAALTGETSGPMLRKLGVRYVIIGHSERRWKLGESDETVNKKLKAALRNDMIPIVCIGERTRDGNFQKFLEDQVAGTFKNLSADEIGKCVIAYEPVWAISTNPGARPDTPQSALESMDIIKKVLIEKFQIPNHKSQTNSKAKITNFKSLFLYGGSISLRNAADFLKDNEIDGVLIGGASVNKDEFVKILKIASQI